MTNNIFVQLELICELNAVGLVLRSVIFSTNIELRTDMSENFHFLKDTFQSTKKNLKSSNQVQCQPHQKSMKNIKAIRHQ